MDVHNTHWIWGDLAQVYVAWAQYLSDPHTHWLTTNRISYPLPMSISLFDPMPLFLLLSKPLAWILPDGIQMIGYYFLVCLVLQGTFGYLATVQALRLLGEKRSNLQTYIGVVGGLLVATVPFTFFRFQFHTALSSQWVLVLSIWVVLATLHAERKQWMVLNCATLFLATGINPYLTLMGAATCAIAVATRVRKLGLLEVCLRCSTLALTAAAGLYLFGFMGATGSESLGYGLFSMNALGPISSAGLGRLNNLKIADPTAYQSLEGFDYLGLGTIILCLFPLTLFFNGRHRKSGFPFLTAVLVIATGYLLALSSTPTLGSLRFHIPLPDSVEYVLSRFRASGRLFWISGFWLIFMGIAACVLRLGARGAAVILTLLLVIQLIDIQPVAFNTKMLIASGATQELSGVPARSYAAISVFPAWECDHDETPLGIRNFESIGFYAVKHKIPTNNFYAARNLPEQIAYHCDYGALPKRIVPNGVYLLSDKIYRAIQPRMVSDFECNNKTNGDGSWLCVPRSRSSTAM
ncbi:hypothetical protein DyAD56_15790 [Dyella sp. AD56]|nr:hypothetical protein DyAD56_15790 [Dyella sp. AD56]